MMTILFVILILALIGALPTWNWSRSWGYTPVGIIVVVLVLLALFGGGLNL